VDDVPIVIRGLQKRYGDRGVAVQALVDVDLVLQAGERPLLDPVVRVETHYSRP
jgi:hypothetical protein